MALPENRRISIELNTNHPDFLRGLELLVQLGLLSDRQILNLSEQHLSDRLPEQVVVPSTPDFILEEPQQSIPSAPRPVVPQRQNLMSQVMRSFQQELSVIWLLVLGVFLVVISSAVLAASQWQNVSPTGQYLVLLGYTLTFWGVSFWAGRQENLRLTANTLQTLTLLLLPVNFWAIDRFLLQGMQPVSGLTAAIAAVILSGVAILSFQQRAAGKAALLGYLALNYLQCGWSLPNAPLIMVYLGTAVTALAVRPAAPLVRSLFPTVAMALLLLRAAFGVDLDITQLGLTFGILGWTVARVALRHPLGVLWTIAAGLLGLGWLASVFNFPGQALLVSGLALTIVWQLLNRNWRRWHVVGLLLIELQSLVLIWRLLPLALQTQWINRAEAWTQGQPVTLLGLVLLPYLIGILGVAHWLERQQKPELSQFTTEIAQVFGACLSLISLPALPTRALNLIASTAILGGWMRNRQSRSLVYGTHLVGLAALTATIHWAMPFLTESSWGLILLVIAIAEWSFSFLNRWPMWQRSAWHLGFGAAALSFVFYFEQSKSLALAWLLIPAMLSGIAWRDPVRRKIAGWGSAIALLLAQVLTMPQRETGLLSLLAATVLMAVNTQVLGERGLAYLTIGAGLATVSWGIWHWVPQFALESWFLAGAIALTLLWQVRRWTSLYAKAADDWAGALSAIVLLGVGLRTVQIYAGSALPNGIAIAATGLTTAALVNRGRELSSDAALLGGGIGLELLVAQGLAGFGMSPLRLSVANVGLGMVTQLASELWQRRGRVWSQAWHALPLLYAGLALLLRWGTWTEWTGWVTLGVALIAIAVGRRLPDLKLWTYLGLIGVSIGAYELVLYRAQRLDWSDQLMAIAAVGTVLMLVYRLPRLELLRSLRLNGAEMRLVAHGHWAVSSVMLSGAATLTLLNPAAPGFLALIGFTTGMVLSLYAIWQARHRPAQQAEGWLYVGLLEAAGLLWYLSTKPWFSGWAGALRPYGGAVSAIVAFLLFVVPWERLGWERRPWQRVAIALPLLVLLGTAAIVQPLSLVVAAVFYALVASIRQQVRWTYISVLLINWLVFDQIHRLNVEWLFWQVLPVGLSILYFAQVEPQLERVPRHYVRICGIGLICLTALLTQENYGILPGVVSLIAIFAGLGLRTRAFLYVGTLVFVLNVLNQLLVFVALYSLLKWIIGLCLGILLIWVAANFETRRDQVMAMMQNWLAELQQWQ